MLFVRRALPFSIVPMTTPIPAILKIRYMPKLKAWSSIETIALRVTGSRESLNAATLVYEFHEISAGPTIIAAIRIGRRPLRARVRALRTELFRSVRPSRLIAKYARKSASTEQAGVTYSIANRSIPWSTNTNQTGSSQLRQSLATPRKEGACRGRDQIECPP